MNRLSGLSLSCLVVVILIHPPTGYLVAQEISIPMSTADRLLTRGWWPTKGTEARNQFIGSAACAGCHAQIVETQKTTPMAHASTPATEANSFPKAATGGPVVLRAGGYTYVINQSATGLSFSVSNGNQSVTAPLAWVFGSGHFGRLFSTSRRVCSTRAS